MADPNWPQLAVGFASGGLAGALLTTIIRWFASRQQPVGHRIEFIPVLKTVASRSGLLASITVEVAGQSTTLSNLCIADVTIANRGNKDLESLKFGATLSGADECIYAETIGPDRHHSARIAKPPTIAEPLTELDVTVTPFNRGDQYRVLLYIAIADANAKPNSIRLGSAAPVVFTDMTSLPSLGDVARLFLSSWLTGFVVAPASLLGIQGRPRDREP